MRSASGTKYISTYEFMHPKHNLPVRQEHEAKFVKAFAKCYLEQAKKIHYGSNKTAMLLSQEIPVNGYGIADIVSVAWNPNHFKRKRIKTISQLADKVPTIRAFEVKLEDWKKGLMQGHRYSYFANSSILVVPSAKIPLLLNHLEIFKTLHVGLWGFNERNKNIQVIYTPRPSSKVIKKYWQVALQCVWDSVKVPPAP